MLTLMIVVLQQQSLLMSKRSVFFNQANGDIVCEYDPHISERECKETIKLIKYEQKIDVSWMVFYSVKEHDYCVDLLTPIERIAVCKWIIKHHQYVRVTDIDEVTGFMVDGSTAHLIAGNFPHLKPETQTKVIHMPLIHTCGIFWKTAGAH